MVYSSLMKKLKKSYYRTVLTGYTVLTYITHLEFCTAQSLSYTIYTFLVPVTHYTVYEFSVTQLRTR